MDIIIYVLLVVVFVMQIISFVLVCKKNSKSFCVQDVKTQEQVMGLSKDIDVLKNSLEIYNKNVVEVVKSYGELQTNMIKNTQNNIAEKMDNQERRMENLSNVVETRLDKNSETLEKNITNMRLTNEQKLDQMRQVVDEKLNESLERRLNESFNLISERLENVSKGLGEMKSLAGSVGDLKKVLTNVKTRGTFGEVQLGNLLEQMLAPNQFKANVTIKEDKRVDYVVFLPGKDDKSIMLPIDAKFPIEDYIRIVDALDSGKLEDIASLSKSLERRIKEEAKKISEKYIHVPLTTDFALMYLPLEGLYSEALKRDGLIEELQNNYRIIVCGPTTLSALLNSLQMGFKTLAIEKRSSEIWDMLSTFKKEFIVFVELLTKTQKKIDEASTTISDATKKTAKIQSQLNKVVLLEDNSLIEKNKPN